jgi:hypothetical protein
MICLRYLSEPGSRDKAPLWLRKRKEHKVAHLTPKRHRANTPEGGDVVPGHTLSTSGGLQRRGAGSMETVEKTCFMLFFFSVAETAKQRRSKQGRMESKRTAEAKPVLAKRDFFIILATLGGRRIFRKRLDGPPFPKGDLGRSLGQRQTCN